MECSCSCSVDYEPNEFCREVIRSARKLHVCCECGEKIAIGDRYHYFTAKNADIGFFDQRTCLPCNRIRDDLCGCGFVFGQLRETIWECMGFDYVTGECIDDDDEADT